MNKEKKIDAVKMMRDIRDELSAEYSDKEREKKELERIRKKYGFD